MKNEAFAPTPELLAKMDAWWRAANYLSACQLYLLDDPLLRRRLTERDIKKKIVGHWGTVPGQNFVAVKDLLDSSGVRYMYLPPYSPDLNPIEKLWPKVKAFLRKIKARTLDALPDAIQCAFQIVSPFDCSDCFHSCGHSPYF